MIPLGTGVHWLAITRAARVRPRHNEHIRDTLAKAFGVTGDLRLHVRINAPRHGNVVVFPHAKAAYKEWPEDCWEAVLSALPDAWVIPATGRTFCGRQGQRVDREGLIHVIAGARLVIAVDSGPVHVADAVGVPVVGLYAATSSRTYGPYNDATHCVDRHREASDELGLAYDSARHLCDGAAMLRIKPDDVLEAIAHV